VGSRKIRCGFDGGRGGGVMRLRGGSVYCGLVRIMIFFLVLLIYDNIMFYGSNECNNFLLCSHVYFFLCGMYKVTVFSIDPYSLALCRIWTAYADCGLFDVLYRMCSSELNS
jgi:hypothetical protein